MIWLLRNWQLALLAALVFALGFMGIRSASLSGRLDRAKARVKDMQQELDAHDRLNKADTGSGLSDADRRKHLRDYAERNSR